MVVRRRQTDNIATHRDPCRSPRGTCTIDYPYTFAGFGALTRCIKVMTTGCPSHTEWGLTYHHKPNLRYRRRLSLEALFAGLYLFYPRYSTPRRSTTTFEPTVTVIRR